MLATSPRELAQTRRCGRCCCWSPPPVGLLDRVLLDQDPLVAAVGEGLDELVGDIGVVGQGHLGGRETADPAEGLQAEEGGEMMLPGPHVQPEVLDRGGGRHGMPPRAAQPLRRLPVARVGRDPGQGVEHVVAAHLAQPVQQRAGVFEHDPGRQPLVEQPGDELAHPPVAVDEHRGIVVVADARVVQHRLQVADDRRGAQIRAARRDERLVHVQGDGEGTVHVTEPGGPRRQEDGIIPAGPDRILDALLRATDVGKAIDVFRKLAHCSGSYFWHECGSYLQRIWS